MQVHIDTADGKGMRGNDAAYLCQGLGMAARALGAIRLSVYVDKGTLIAGDPVVIGRTLPA